MDDSGLAEKSCLLQSLPPKVHWFCPRDSDDDSALYEESDDSGAPDAQNDSRRRKIREAKPRMDAGVTCLKLLAFETEEMAPFNEWYKGRLDFQMRRCHICVRNYHRGKIKLLENLREEHDEHDVQLFSKALGEFDLKRITSGLISATTILQNIPTEKRSIAVLDSSLQFCIFEALSAEAALKSEDFVSSHLEEPFRLVQSRRLLGVADYVPAMGWFLFGADEFRATWAVRSWSKMKRRLQPLDFQWIVQEPLLAAMQHAAQAAYDSAFLRRFWRGVRMIVERLDKSLITHSLRALDIDIYRLALDHVQLDHAPLGDILQTVQILLDRSPGDFWDAMGAISPTTLIELICNTSVFGKVLNEVNESSTPEPSSLHEILAWIDPFMASLKPANKPPACRAFAVQLMERFQLDTFPEVARLRCFHVGLQVLSQTLRSFVDEKASVDASVGRVVVSEIMEVVSRHISSIISVATLPQDDESHGILATVGLDVVRNALALDCQCLRSDFDTLLMGKSLHEGTASYSQSIWGSVAERLPRNHVPLARNILIGIVSQVGLEKLSVKTHTGNKKDCTQFNNAYGQLLEMIARIFDRMSDFDPEKLDLLYDNTQISNSLLAGFFASDAAVYDAALDVAKIVSAQSGRREALTHLLKAFFEHTMSSLAWNVRRISNRKTFGCNVRMLKTCGDVLDILCDSQEGLLRSKPLTETDQRLVGSFWQYQWQAVTDIFATTETWALVNDKDTMKEFCRDTMQFAARLFDQYSVFASAVDSSKDGESDPNHSSNRARRKLLDQPTLTMRSMVKWLRLKDEYLASTSVGLVCNILHTLAGLGISVANETVHFIRKVAVTGQTTTALAPQEKAELRRALDEHLQMDLLKADTLSAQIPKREKQGSLNSWMQVGHAESKSAIPRQSKDAGKEVIDLEKWRAKASSPRLTIALDEDSNEITDEILEASRSIERYKAVQDSKRPASQPTSMKQAYPQRLGLSSEAQEAFRKKREKEKLEKARRDREQIARLKGSKDPSDTGVAQASGLNSIGVKGKDHTPQSSEMMVSSESESEDEDDDELDRALFGRAKAQKVSQSVQEYQESKMRSLKAAKQQGPVKKIKQVRNAKDMRARLAPDLSALHHEILSWDFFEDSNFPPNSGRDNYSLVSNTFRTAHDYQSTFGALLILEAWQGFLKAKEDGNFKKFEIKIVNRLSVDSFIEISSSIPSAEGRDLGLGEADIVLISKGESPMDESRQPHCLARIHKINRKRAVLEVSYRINVGQPILSSMVPNAVFRGVKITSVTPLEREYGALHGLQYYDLCDEIIRAKPSPLLNYSEKLLDPIVQNYKLNLAQAKAVRSALDNDAFTLIQGPPGSGKTSTIVAIVGALLTSSLVDVGIAVSRPQSNMQGKIQHAKPTSKKLLVCAPSNAAVDELVLRFKQGIKTTRGETHTVSIVRLGRSDAINTNVVDVTLEELVNKKLNMTTSKKTNPGDEINKLVEQIRTMNETLSVTRAKLDELRAKGEGAAELQRQFDDQKRQKAQTGTKLDELRDKSKAATRDAEINRRRVQQEILDGAHIICATLSGSGHDMFQSLSIEFETVVIDEAAQSVELSALIPLKYGCAKCILVGDPKQLPPTVLSREAARFQYEQSLFVRMQLNHPKDVHLLDTQYRMHPNISEFPSRVFYDGMLLDGPNMAHLRRRPWHNTSLLAPYRFFDVQGEHQRASKGHSLYNVAELRIALQLYERLIADFGNYDYRGKIGIITPYKGQLRELKMRFSQRFGDSIFESVEFNTTDAFQGRESEIIIFSCVRASPSRGIGFLDDIRRMNVGLTRAKCSLWVLGNARSLIRDEFWGKLIEDARQRNRYTDGDIAALLQKPTEGQDFEMTDSAGRVEMGQSMLQRPPRDTRPFDYKDVAMSEAVPSLESVQYTSGGRYGMDTTATCAKCGSWEHSSSSCDNEAAKANIHPACLRCRGYGHSSASCDAVRCETCGQIGHTKAACTSAVQLSTNEKNQVKRQEALHRVQKRAYAEKMKKKRLGGHDETVPTITSTRKTPPLDAKGVVDTPVNVPKSKRKRQPSPPTDLISLNSGKYDAKPVVLENGTKRDEGDSQEPTPSTKPRGPIPPKRKKEVNPFIVPNRRKPRP